jgi:D-glycero-alpha-D-manno-heptose-7-phosphate kinase
MIIVRSPFRLPLGGGGTDLPSYYNKYEGFLITATINKYMFVNINEPALVNKIKIGYSKIEIVELNEIENIQHDIVREALKYLNIRKPLEIHSMADLAAGTGMGSSSSYTVALLKGLNTLNSRFISLQDAAEEACKIEIELCKKPIGKQDQYASTFGGINQLNIDKLGNVTVTPIKIKQETIYEIENRLMMFYTNINRDTNTIIKEQNNKIITNEDLAAESMHNIKKIGIKIKDSLLNDDIDSFGNLLNEHWLEKKKISKQMSNYDIDRWYDIGMKNGAIGGKIMGAGGGGFLLFCVKNGERQKLRTAMEKEGLEYMDFRFDFEGVKVLANI